MASDINIKKGNPYSATITITDSDGAAYSLVGKTVFFTVKHLSDTADNDTSAIITKNITVHTDALGGITTLSLTAAQTNQVTGQYKYDFRIYWESESVVYKINSDTGFCYITDIVTKRTT